MFNAKTKGNREKRVTEMRGKKYAKHKMVHNNRFCVEYVQNCSISKINPAVFRYVILTYSFRISTRFNKFNRNICILMR